MSPEDVREQRKVRYLQTGFAEKGKYHSFELPDGSQIEGLMPLERQKLRYSLFPIPDDLRGATVLDVGAWEGWFSFEAEKHGATVTAVDCVEVSDFLERRRAYHSRVDYRVLDVYELPESGLGPYDYTFFLGVLYHLKHPLLALEIVCGLTREIAIVESFVTDGDCWQEHKNEIPTMEFYETTELGDQMDNWIGPSVACLLALCRAAGFARVELIRTERWNAMVACYRRWSSPKLAPAIDSPELKSVVHARNYGINFNARKDEYITWTFRSNEAGLTREAVYLEVDGFGVPACYLQAPVNGWWMANSRLPPGLGSGWKSVRLRTAGSGYSNSLEIAVDMRAECRALEIRSAADGTSWRTGEWHRSSGRVIACWVAGLPENADLTNVHASIGQQGMRVLAVAAPDENGFRQVNLEAPPGLPAGEFMLTVSVADVQSSPYPIRAY